jgi:hypothetical protein
VPLSEWEPKDEHTIISEAGPIKLNIRRVESSNIDWVGWPQNGNKTMVVQFADGSRYAYVGVSRQRANALARAESSGAYLAKYIKPHYEVAKLR